MRFENGWGDLTAHVCVCNKFEFMGNSSAYKNHQQVIEPFALLAVSKDYEIRTLHKQKRSATMFYKIGSRFVQRQVKLMKQTGPKFMSLFYRRILHLRRPLKHVIIWAVSAEFRNEQCNEIVPSCPKQNSDVTYQITVRWYRKPKAVQVGCDMWCVLTWMIKKIWQDVHVRNEFAPVPRAIQCLSNNHNLNLRQDKVL